MTTSRLPVSCFQFGQFTEEPARIANAIKTVGAVLQQHAATVHRQFSRSARLRRAIVSTRSSRDRGRRNKKAHRPATTPFLHDAPSIISDPTRTGAQLRGNDDDLLAHLLDSLSGKSAAMRFAITGQSAFSSYQFASDALLLASSVSSIVSISSAPTVHERGGSTARGPLRTNRAMIRRASHESGGFTPGFFGDVAQSKSYAAQDAGNFAATEGHRNEQPNPQSAHDRRTSSACAANRSLRRVR